MRPQKSSKKNGEVVAVWARGISIDLQGSVAVPSGFSVTQFLAYYRFVAFPGALLQIRSVQTAETVVNWPVPDVEDAGAELCVAAISGDLNVTLMSERCELPRNLDPFSLALHAPPAVSLPDSGTLEPTSEFSWTAFDGGVYVVSFESDDPSGSFPNVCVLTADPTIVLGDVPALSATSRADGSYSIRVEGSVRSPRSIERLALLGSVLRRRLLRR